MAFPFFILIIFIIILIIMNSNLKIEIQDFKAEINTQNDKVKFKLSKNYKIKIMLKFLKLIPIFYYKIDYKKINKIIDKMKRNNNTRTFKILSKLDYIKKLHIKLLDFNFKIIFGTENAEITALSVPIIYTIIAFILNNLIQIYSKKPNIKINPIYNNQNFICIEFSSIFSIKMIHIISTICVNKQKERGDKNVRTSNRRTYEYNYE